MTESPGRIHILLLPGLHGTETLFRSFLERNSFGYRVSAISYPTQESLSYSELTNLVLEKITGITTRFFLLGESFSGPLALFVANHHPEGLCGVILAASFVKAPVSPGLRWLPWETGFRITSCLARGVMNPAIPSQSSQVCSQMLQELPRVSCAVLANRIRSILNVDASSALLNCPVPLLYLAGEKDWLVGKQPLRKILELRPDVLVRTYPASHFLLQSVPGEIWKDVDWFIHHCGF